MERWQIRTRVETLAIEAARGVGVSWVREPLLWVATFAVLGVHGAYGALVDGEASFVTAAVTLALLAVGLVGLAAFLAGRVGLLARVAAYAVAAPVAGMGALLAMGDPCGRLRDYERNEVEGVVARVFERGGVTDAFDLAVTRVEGVQLASARGCVVRVRVFDPRGAVALALREHDAVAMRLRVKPLAGPLNPGEGDRRASLMAQGVFRTASVAPDHVRVVARAEANETMRGWASGVIAGRAALDEETRDILRAMLTGERPDLMGAISRTYRVLGLSHLIVVSGMHLTLTVGAVAFALHRLLLIAVPVTQGGAALVAGALAALTLVFPYVAFTGGGASTWRAALALAMAAFAVLLRRPVTALNVMGATGLAQMAMGPLLALTPGMQLSYAAVMGLVVLTGRFSRALGGAERRAGRGVVGWFGGAVAASLAASLAAFVATWPVLVWHFGEAPVAAIVLNLLAIPLTTFAVLPLGYVGLLLMPLTGAVGGALIDGAGMALGVLHHVMRWCEPWLSALALDAGSSLAVAGVGLVVVGARELVTTRRQFYRAVGAAAVLGAVVAGASAGVAAVGRRALTLRHFSVSQGDATLLTLPDGGEVLIDTGPDTSHDGSGVNVAMMRALAALSVSEVESVVITHGHADHIGGLRGVVAALGTRVVYAPTHLVGRVEEVVAAARAGGQTAGQTAVVGLTRGDTLALGAVRLDVLWPTRDDGAMSETVRRAVARNENNRSLVVRARYGAARALFAADIERVVERELVRRDAGALRAGWLKVAHQGSNTSSSDVFLNAVAPAYALVPAGPAWVGRWPHGDALARLQNAGADVLVTRDTGMVRVDLFADGAQRVFRLRRESGTGQTAGR